MVKNISLKQLIWGIVSLFMVACSNDKKELFTIETEDAFTFIRNESKCLQIFSDDYGVSKSMLQDENYLNSLLIRFFNENAKEKYSSLSFLRLKETGELNYWEDYSIRVDENGKASIKILSKEKIKDLEVRDFSFEELTEKLGNGQEPKKGTKIDLLLIHFPSKSSVECFTFNNLSVDTKSKIQSLRLFE